MANPFSIWNNFLEGSNDIPHFGGFYFTTPIQSFLLTGQAENTEFY